MAKNFKIWVLNPSVKVLPDAVPEDRTWEVRMKACRGEVENIQIALRAEEERVTVRAELNDLVQALGETLFDKQHLQMRLVEGDCLVPFPESLILEPGCTRAVWITAAVPEETAPCAYQGGIILRTDTEELYVLLSVTVLDIKMPSDDCYDLNTFAGKYGLKGIVELYTHEKSFNKSGNTIRLELLRDAADDLRLLWLLEQTQIKVAGQQSLDPDSFDPATIGREIYAPIISKQDGSTKNITDPMQSSSVRSNLIAAIKKAQIPYVDTRGTLTVKAEAAPTTPADFAYGTEGRYCFQFQIEWSPVEMVKKGDYFRLTFRDLFSGTCTFFKYPMEAPESGDTKLVLTAENVKLKPSSYHVRVDIMHGDCSLSGIAPGGCQIYITREGESLMYMFGSFIASRLGYMWDEKQSLYYHMLPGNLSQSGDPFDPIARSVYERALHLEIVRVKYEDWTGYHPMNVIVPEAQHDAGSGILRAARAFRKMGEMDRALFCEQAVKRIVNRVLAGKIITNQDRKPGITFPGPHQQQNILLKLLCDACLYFRDEAGDHNYAQKLFESVRLIGAHQMMKSNVLGASEGKVYDGRVLVGLAVYCLTEYTVNREFNKDHVDTILDFALRISENTILHKGWHDYGGMDGHHGYGTMNVLWGLLPARQIALEAGRHDMAETLKKGIFVAFDFLARTNGGLTGYTQWIPSRHGGWCAGDMHEMLDEIERQFGTNKTLQWYRLHLSDRNIAYFAQLTSGYVETSSLGSRNALPAYLMECDEYKNAVLNIAKVYNKKEY